MRKTKTAREIRLSAWGGISGSKMKTFCDGEKTWERISAVCTATFMTRIGVATNWTDKSELLERNGWRACRKKLRENR